jgi:hypothetical protein
MSVAALIDLRDSLDTMLHQIRSERHISSPVPLLSFHDVAFGIVEQNVLR